MQLVSGRLDVHVVSYISITASFLKGDVVTRVNNVRVNSVKQVTRLINKTKGKKCVRL